jgi:hypothetical protein
LFDLLWLFDDRLYQPGLKLRATDSRGIHPFLAHDVQDLFFAENGILLLDDEDDTVPADIEGIGVKLPHDFPARFLCLEGNALSNILRVALHDLPARPIRSQRHLIPSSDSPEITGILCMSVVNYTLL